MARATFWRIVHHDGKISPAWWGWGVHAPTSFHYIYHHVQSCGVVWCTLQLRGQIHSPYFNYTSSSSATSTCFPLAGRFANFRPTSGIKWTIKGHHIKERDYSSKPLNFYYWPIILHPTCYSYSYSKINLKYLYVNWLLHSLEANLSKYNKRKGPYQNGSRYLGLDVRPRKA